MGYFYFWSQNRNVGDVYTITGYAYDANGSTGVVGATIALGAYSATSGAGGAYTISNVPSGTSGSMTCTLAGYSWTAKTISAMSGNLTAQNYTNAWWAAGGCAATAHACYRAIGAASFAASKVNLVSGGTHDLENGAAYPTWASGTGWSFVRTSSQYLASDFVIATGDSIFVRIANAATGASYYGCVVGGRNNADSNGIGINPYYGSSQVNFTNGNSVANAPHMVNGNLGIVATNGYKDGVSVVTLAGGHTNTTIAAYVGCLNDRGTATGFYTGDILAVAHYTGALSAGQITAVVAAMAALS